MSNLTSSKAYIQVEATRQRSAVSEFLAQTIGGAINYLNDQDTSNTTHFTNIAANTVCSMSVNTFAASSGHDPNISLSSGQVFVGWQFQSGSTISLPTGALFDSTNGLVVASGSGTVHFNGSSLNRTVYYVIFTAANISI